MRQKKIGVKAFVVEFLTLTFLFFGPASDAFSQEIERIDPPFWFSSMENPELELLIYGKDISKAGSEIRTDSSAMVIGIFRCEQPDYLFLRLNISDCKSGFNIHWKQGKKNRQFHYELRQKIASQSAPAYVNEKDIVYLLMPDRFANGDPANDEISRMHQNKVHRNAPLERHGGDLKGISDQLDYIQNLGMTTLWLNPVQTNDQPHESYHGYAITDHYQIDPRLGTLTDYFQLVRSCHNRNMKVIMDVVYNHWGNEHLLYKNPPFKHWFHRHDSFYQTSYRATTLMDPYAAPSDRTRMLTGWFDRHMPDLNLSDSFLSKYMIQNTLWWIAAAGLNGLRIDTYAYPGMAFTESLLNAIYKEFPEMYVVGEIWDHGIPIQAWFAENQMNTLYERNLPALTDFQLHFALQRAFTEPFGWTEGLNRIYYVLSQDFLYQHPYQFITFLDNHDVDRVAGIFNRDTAKIKAALTLMLTTRGIPCIYYGTELGWSEKGNHGLLRRDMPGGWKEDSLSVFKGEGFGPYEKSIFDHLQRLSKLRTSYEAFTQGKLTQYVPEQGVYVYFRSFEEQQFMVIVNQDPSSKWLDLNRFSEQIKQQSLFNVMNHTKPGLEQNKLLLKPMESLILKIE